MNNIINLKRLVELIAQASGCSLGVADAFVRAFTTEVKEGLRNGEQVTIKGLGTFTLSNGPEKNVYLEVDNELADKVNAPFAMFVNEELASDVSQTDFENPSRTLEILKSEQLESEKKVTDEVVIPTKKTDKNGFNGERLIEVHPDTIPPKEEETIETIEESELTINVNPTEGYVLEPDENITSTSAMQEDAKEYSLVPEEEPINIPQPEKTEAKEAKTEIISEPVKASPPFNSIEAQEPDVDSTQQIHDIPTPPSYYEDYEEEEEEEEYDNQGSKSSIPYLWIIWSIVIGFLIGLLVGFFLHEPIMKKFEPSLTELEIEELELEDEELQIEGFKETTDSISPTANDSIAETYSGSEQTATIETATEAPASQTEKAVSDEPVYDVVTKSLTDLARKHYGEKDFWIYIYLENSDKIGDPSRVQKNTRVKIPPLEKYATSPSRDENLRLARNEIAKVLSKYKN